MTHDPSEIILLPPRRDNPSKILRYMTPEERLNVEKELLSELTIWSDHPQFNPKNPRANVLKHGKSFHIYNINFIGEILEDYRHLFPKTLEYIHSWTGEDMNKLGRSYWHRLMPGERIELHHDNSNGYFRTVKRHHLYMDVPLDFHVVLDGHLWNVYPENKLTNALVSFNLFDWHYFINHTDRPMYMLVFDFYPG